MDVTELLQISSNWLITSGLHILLIIVVALTALFVVRRLSQRIFAALFKDEDEEEMHKRAETLGSLLQYVLSVSILLTAFVMVLGELGVDIGPILAAAGVVGLALGFGSQHLVQDVISGFFILLDDQLRVGDYVKTAGKDGIVERVNLRMTVLRDLSGNVHYVRNGMIDVVTNMTKDYSCYMFKIGVAYRENVDEVIDVIRQVDQDLRSDPACSKDILEPIDVLGLDEFADSALIIKARTKTKPMKQWRVAREFNRRLKKAFDERGIEIPFPHVTLYAGQDKNGQAAPIHIVTEPNEKT